MPSNKRGERKDVQQTSPWKVSFFTALLTSIITIMGALWVAKLHDTLERSRRIEQERREVYANLRGTQRLAESLIGIRINATIRRVRTEAMVKIIGEKHFQHGMLLDESRRLLQFEEALDGQIGQAFREFYKYIAMTEILFPNTPELRKHIANAYTFNGIRILDMDKAGMEQFTADNVQSWYNRVNEEGRELILREFREPTHALFDYLASQIRAQRRKEAGESN